MQKSSTMRSVHTTTFADVFSEQEVCSSFTMLDRLLINTFKSGLSIYPCRKPERNTNGDEKTPKILRKNAG